MLYKRSKEAKWQGPAQVLGRDGHSYLLKHSYQFIKVHPRDMQLYNSREEEPLLNQNRKDNDTNIPLDEVHGHVSTTRTQNNGRLPVDIPAVVNINNEHESVATEGSDVVKTTSSKLPKVKSRVEYLPKSDEGIE